jgi:hypothetical protein
MAAGTYNLQIDQGSDFAMNLALTEGGVVTDLTNYSARAQMRSTKDSATVAATFTCTIMNAAGGTLQVALPNATSAALEPGLYYYDLEIYTSGDGVVTRILEGTVTIDQNVTR